MSKSTALPDMTTTHDVTSPLNSVPGPGHRFAPPPPPKVDFGSEKEHFPFSIFKNKFRHDYKPVWNYKLAEEKRYENFVSEAL